MQRKVRQLQAFARQIYNYEQKRYLNIHEYQGAQVMSSYGINVPVGEPVFKLEEIVPTAKKLADKNNEVVIKSQILAGGRGLGKFTNGFQGGVHITTVDKAQDIASKMLHQTLVTKQTGPAGKPVNVLYLAKKLQISREMYLAFLLDRETAGPILIGCSEGGTSIEDLAEKYPDKILKMPIDIRVGITDEQCAKAVESLGIQGDKNAAKQQIRNFYDLFTKADCTLVEVNPLAEDHQGNLIAADSKIGFDDSASFRQQEIFKMRDSSQEDPREVQAQKFDLNYIGLDGNIGCMVNGAGLAMATLDIIQLRGGKPANFLDVGGGASEEQVTEAFKILTSDKTVKAILVNIFGGIMRCDVIASGIVNACQKLKLNVPVVVRLEGTNVAKGKEILANSDTKTITADDLDDAARKAVAEANK